MLARRFMAMLFICASAVAAEKNEPSTWAEFNASKTKDDEQILQRIGKAKWWTNCERFGKTRRAKQKTREFYALRLHLENEDMLNGIDFMNIAERQIAIGMTQCGVFAAIGIPARTNNTTNKRGSSAQLVYENSSYRYIYTEEIPGLRQQIVRSFQY